MWVGRDVSAVVCEHCWVLLSRRGFSRLEVGLAEVALAVAARLACMKLLSTFSREYFIAKVLSVDPLALGPSKKDCKYEKMS